MAGTKPGIEVSGAKELRKALKHMGNDLGDLREINLEAAKDVANEGRHRAPHRSGTLAGSVKPRATKTRGYVTAGSRSIPYAGPIHFGWLRHNIAPQPFLFNALDNRKTAIVDRYSERVGALVVRVGRETPP